MLLLYDNNEKNYNVIHFDKIFELTFLLKLTLPLHLKHNNCEAVLYVLIKAGFSVLLL